MATAEAQLRGLYHSTSATGEWEEVREGQGVRRSQLWQIVGNCFITSVYTLEFQEVLIFSERIRSTSQTNSLNSAFLA
jgi:hypothetical protein